jgi:hypothetical protein
VAVIVVVGLRRSGTTALWRSFQQLPEFIGLYEPFNPKLARPTAVDHKQVWADLRAIAARDPVEFARLCTPIAPIDEASDVMSAANADYLRWLLDGAASSNVVLSMVRCGFKLRALHNLVGPSVLLHISREPVAWIASHLHPTEQGSSYAQQRLRARLPVVRERSMPRDYALDRVVASPAFTARLDATGISAARFRRLTAAQRLYLLWLLHERQVQADGRAVWPAAQRLVSHAEFVSAPAPVVADALTLAGVVADSAAIQQATEHVRAYRPAGAPASVSARIARDVAALKADTAIDTSLTAPLATLHGAGADAA